MPIRNDIQDLVVLIEYPTNLAVSGSTSLLDASSTCLAFSSL